MNAIQYLDNFFYSRFQSNWDDEILRQKILSNLKSSDVILDLGAGAGIVAAMDFKGKCAIVHGADLDPRVLENNYLDHGCITNASNTPYDDNSFDLVFADNLMEHLTDPLTVFKEIKRILKPGGSLIFKTPNKNHYVPIIARFTTHSFHSWVNKKRGRSEIDTFKTEYLCNSRSQVSKLASSVELEVKEIAFVEGRPEYLRFSTITYFFGIIYEKLVNSFDLFMYLRVVMVVRIEKKF